MNRKLTLLLAALLTLALFKPAITKAQTNVTVSILTDCWGGESSWSVADADGNVLSEISSGTYGNTTTYDTDLSLDDGCYVFTMGDTYGDGLNGSAWGSCGVDGNYTVTDEFGNVLVQMTVADFDNEAVHYFTLPFGDVDGCTDPEADNYDPCAVNDDGSCLYPPIAAEFTFDAPSYCQGTTVQFIDQSVGNPVQWDWSFVGGNPFSSTDQNPAVTFDNSGTFAASLTVTSGSGETSTISYDVTINEGLLMEVVIVQDNYPGETSWDVMDEFGNVVASGDVNGSEFCIEDNCHQFTIYDSYGDGICCGYGQGSFSILLDGIEIATGGEFSSQQSVNVNCPPGIDCNNAIDVSYGINTAPYPNSWFVFVPDTSGQFEITTCDLATCDTEIWVYDYCNMLLFDDSNEATLTWNDDFCGVQAQVTPLLEEGLTYYMRIGDQASACGTDPIDFEVSFLGGVSGCMDPLACNYLPIAVEPDVCYFPGDPECPTIGPDLEILGDVFYNSMYYTTLTNDDACYVNEGCMQGFGEREIVRFTTHIKNVGTEDYFIGAPSGQPDQFEWDDCHNHWHYEGYAEYVLYDENGVEMPEVGFKNGFCVLDLECSDGGTAKYTCGNMGITAGCGDIYSSGLSCQWVDVTNVPAGSYTMLMRTNWDQSPDANGSYELSYDNNWATVCISFDRDVDGNLINFEKFEDCPIVFDCLGQAFGNAQPDCLGNCPGILATGDLDSSGELDGTDVDQYLSDILGNDAIVSPCTDLNGDGEVNVTDAAVAAGCVYYGPDHVDELGVHDHCIWESEIVNPNHTVTLSIGEINTELGYVDIHVLNPDNDIVAYEFDVSGLTIQTVENLVDPADFDATPQASLGGTKVICTSFNELMVPKNYSPAPLMRINYFEITGTEICIDVIVDVVNEDYHNVVTVAGPCVPATNPDFADFTSTTTTICEGETIDFLDLSVNADGWDWNFEGGTPATSVDQNPAGIQYNVAGTYSVTLTASSGSTTDSETKVAYITVDPATTYYADTDGDGYGDPNSSVNACIEQAGYVTDNTDCDDTNEDIYPGAPGTGEYIDNNCNGLVEGDELGPCTGDFNGDQFVDVQDLLEFLAAFGCTSNCGQYDLDGDDAVDSADLLEFLPAFGYPCE